MKKVKSLNGYSIFEAGPRDVDKYGYEAGSFYVFFSSDIRDFGIANSSPEYDGLDTLEAAEACCLGNYAKAREIVEGRTTAASFEEIAEVERQLDNGEIDDDGEPVEISDEPELKQSIGRKIRELRKARHMTQSELAARPELPISQASLAAYETGAREPGMEMIAAFARFFHVSVDYLFGMTPDQEQVGDSALRLSENARAFLRCSDGALLETISSVLSASAATEFFEDLRAYVMACSPGPEDLAELPKMPKQEAAYLDEAEARQLLVLLHQEPIKYRAMITFDLLSGLRRGELLGLRWQDVDFENQTITIVNTLNYAPGAGVYVDTPKNTTSARPLKLSPTAFSMLLEYKRWQDDQRDACGDYWKDTVGRVFTGDDGAPVFPDSLTKWFAAFVKRSGLPDVHIHSLRHTYASLMIADGTPLPVVSRRLGHAQVSTTANIYAHAIASADEKAAQIAEKFADVVTTPEDCQATGKRKSPAKRRGRLELVG